jgi:hypothetical protein
MWQPISDHILTQKSQNATPTDQTTTMAIGATKPNGLLPKIVMLAALVDGQNWKQLAVSGPSQDSLILALGTSTAGPDYLQLN